MATAEERGEHEADLLRLAANDGLDVPEEALGAPHRLPQISVAALRIRHLRSSSSRQRCPLMCAPYCSRRRGSTGAPARAEGPPGFGFLSSRKPGTSLPSWQTEIRVGNTCLLAQLTSLSP